MSPAYNAACPPRGYIGIFNRSHYEDVLITQVHDWITDKEAERRLQAIRDFEVTPANNGTRILKFLLNISNEEQKTRLLARVDDANKHWKIGPTDLEERGYWKAYRKAFEKALSATSTEEAPWFVVPVLPITSGTAISWWLSTSSTPSRIWIPRPPKVEEIDWTKLRRDVSES